MSQDPWEQALEQLSVVCKVLGLSEEQFSKLSTHDRVVERTLEVEMDSGETKEFQAFRAQHSNVLGPYKGGIRFHPGVTREEVMALSMWMTWKTSVAQLPLGGGKGGVVVNPKELSEAELERLARAYVQAFEEVIGPDVDIPAPDVNTNPQVLGWMVDEYVQLQNDNDKSGSVEGDTQLLASFTGKPLDKGGSEGRVAATGRGGFIVLRELMKKLKKKPAEVQIAIQGLGNVGYWFAKLACEAGYDVVAVSDSRGGIVTEDRSCLDLDKLMEHKKKTGSVAGFDGTKDISGEEVLELDVDVVVPAALEGVITGENADMVKAGVVLELANGPVTPDGEAALDTRNVLVVPDILANAGGVSVSYFEWLQNRNGEKWSEREVNEKLERTMVDAFEKVWGRYQSLEGEGLVRLRIASYGEAVERIVEAAEG